MTHPLARRFVGAVVLAISGAFTPAISSRLDAQSAPPPSEQPPCHCAGIFAHTVERLEREYVAFPLEVTGTRLDAWRAHVDAIRPAAATADRLTCSWLLRRLLSFFRDGHLLVIDLPSRDTTGMTIRRSSRPTRDVSPTGAWSEARVRATLDARVAARDTLATVEGIWQGPGFRIAVQREPSDRRQATGVLVAVDSGGWSPGQVRAEFVLIDGRWRATLWDEAFRERSSPVESSRGALLRMAPTLWGRLYPVERFAFLQAANPRHPTIAFPDDSTAVVSVVTFDPSYGVALRRAIQAEWPALRDRRRVVIDLRGNEGGSSGEVLPLLPFLWSATSLPQAGDAPRDALVRSAPANIEFWQRSGWAPRGLIDRLLAAPGMLVPFAPDAKPPSPPTPPLLSRADQDVVVLVDHTTISAAEQVVLWVRQMGRARIIGEPTAGGIDYQSTWITRVACPAMGQALSIPMIATSGRLPVGGYNATGIVPERVAAVTGDWLARLPHR